MSEYLRNWRIQIPAVALAAVALSGCNINVDLGSGPAPRASAAPNTIQATPSVEATAAPASQPTSIETPFSMRRADNDQIVNGTLQYKRDGATAGMTFLFGDTPDKNIALNLKCNPALEVSLSAGSADFPIREDLYQGKLPLEVCQDGVVAPALDAPDTLNGTANALILAGVSEIFLQETGQ